MGYIFGKKIQELRKAKGLTLEDIAKQIDSCKGYISRIESCKRKPPSDKIVKKLARILGVDKKILLRIAHIDKIPEDIKQELAISTIITPKKIVDIMKIDLASLIREAEGKKKKNNGLNPPGYVPVIINNNEKFPEGFSDFKKILEEAKEFIQFSLTGVNIAFAIRMPDISMTKKEGISFPQGSLVFFSPCKRLKIGDCLFVLYKTEEGLSTLFRYLKNYNRKSLHLISLNSRFRKEIILPRRIVENSWKAIACLKIFE